MSNAKLLVEKLERNLNKCRKHLADSVANECKCETNTEVNTDLLNRALDMKKTLIRIAFHEYGRPTEMMNMARKCLKKNYPHLKEGNNE